jgi:hypothetical protein
VHDDDQLLGLIRFYQDIYLMVVAPVLENNRIRQYVLYCIKNLSLSQVDVHLEYSCDLNLEIEIEGNLALDVMWFPSDLDSSVFNY